MKGTNVMERARATTVISNISRVIVGPFDLQELLDRVARTLQELSSADACSIWLIDDDKKLRIKAGRGYHERLLETCPTYLKAMRAGRVDEYTQGLPIPAEYELGEGVTGRIAATGKPIRTTGKKPHREAHPGWKGKYDHVQWPGGGQKCISFFGAPLMVRKHVIGVVKVENKRDARKELACAS